MHTILASFALTKTLAGDPTRNRPRVALTVHARVKRSGRIEVTSAHASVLPRSGAAFSSRSFDDGVIVVGTDATTGELLGVELLRPFVERQEPPAIPELLGFLGGRTCTLGEIVVDLNALWGTYKDHFDYHWVEIAHLLRDPATTGEAIAEGLKRSLAGYLAICRRHEQVPEVELLDLVGQT